jgi:hypothetical protein
MDFWANQMGNLIAGGSLFDAAADLTSPMTENNSGVVNSIYLKEFIQMPNQENLGSVHVTSSEFKYHGNTP